MKRGLAVVLLTVAGFSVPASAVLIDEWVADDLVGLGDGATVDTWDSTNGLTVGDNIAGHRRPTLVLGSFNGRAGVRFDGGGATGNEGDFLRSPDAGTNNPLSGAEDYSIAVVFRAKSGGANIAGSTQWWGKSGIVDSGEGGAQAEYGLAIGDQGVLWAGHGNPDASPSGGGSVVGPQGHVAIMTEKNGKVTLWLDGANVASDINGSTDPRRTDGSMTFGCLNDAIFGGFARCSNVDIGQVSFYDNGLNRTAVRNTTNYLAASYGVVPEPSTMAVMAAIGLGGGAFARRRRRA